MDVANNDGQNVPREKTFMRQVTDFFRIPTIFAHLVLYLFCTWARVILRFVIPDRPKSLKNEIVLVTGGGNGIGKELCLELAKQESDLTIITWDVNEEGNSDTVDQVKALGVERAYGFTVDVSDRKQVQLAANKIRAEIGDVTILFNNAGIAGQMKQAWLQDSGLMEKVFGVNVLGQCWTLQEFLPRMMEQKKGHVIQTCSCLSLYYSSLASTYIATKHAIKGYMESVKEDLRNFGGEDIHMSLVYIGLVATNLTAPFNIKFKWSRLDRAMHPSYVAQRMVASMRQNEEHIYIPGSIQFLYFLKTLFPSPVIRKTMDLLGASSMCRRLSFDKSSPNGGKHE